MTAIGRRASSRASPAVSPTSEPGVRPDPYVGLGSIAPRGSAPPPTADKCCSRPPRASCSTTACPDWWSATWDITYSRTSIGSSWSAICTRLLPLLGGLPYRRLAQALKALDARVRGVDAHLLGIDPTDPDVLAGGADLGLATDLGMLDVVQQRPAVDYTGLRARAVRGQLGAETTLLADADDLVAMKLRAGRPIDLQDIAAITAHERHKRPPPGGGPAPP
jgi:hypothetical protein